MGVRTELRRSVLAGVLIVAPIAVTVVVLRLAYGYLLGILGPIVRDLGLTNLVGGEPLAAQALALSMVLAALLGLGFLAQRSIGERLFGGFDRLVGFVPLVSTVYSGVRQVANTLVSGESRYESVVVVEYPRLSVYSLGFVTGDAPAAVRKVAGEDAVNVFVPNSPNPTGGRLMIVPERQVHETDIPIRRGLRLVMTTGITQSAAETERLRRESLPPETEPDGATG